MKILGPDALVFGVDDLDACYRYLTDYGLKKVDSAPERRNASRRWTAPRAGSPGIGCGACRRRWPPRRTSATRSTAWPTRRRSMPSAPNSPSDRDVSAGSDGVLRSIDDTGYPIGFQVSAATQD